MTELLLQAERLTTIISQGNGRERRVVDGVDLSIRSGEILGLVGESGSGKTMFSLSLLALLPPSGRVVAGRLHWKGQEVDLSSLEDRRRLRGRQIAMIFQSPQAALSPVHSVGYQIGAVLRLHHRLSRREARGAALRMLEDVGVVDPEARLKAYPHELSGGMCQRVMIAVALACKPALLIADEPTSNLDVTIQAQILRLLRQVCSRFGMTVLLITHDLAVVAELCDRVAVMYQGRIVEEGSVADVYARPRNPYTRHLLTSASP